MALASHAISLMSDLLDDLRVEVGQSLIESISSSLLTSQGVFSVPDITERYTAWQRVQKLTSNVNLTNLLFSLASVSYRKVNIFYNISLSCHVYS